jgi:uncharacterized protein DUF4915
MKFSMPHSPRLYDGKLWLLNSGAGEFGTVDPASGTFTPVCFCPGYARGLAFVGRHAVIGLSRPRRGGTFSGLALDERLAENGRRRTAWRADRQIRRHPARDHRRADVTDSPFGPSGTIPDSRPRGDFPPAASNRPLRRPHY